MKVVKGEIFEGDSFTWKGQQGRVIQITWDGVIVGFNYTKKNGFQLQVKLYFDGKYALKKLVKKFDLTEEETEEETTLKPTKMKTKTTHEFFFEFSSEIRTISVFSGVMTGTKILDNIEKTAQAYVKKNFTLFTQNESARNNFDKLLRIIKHPYFIDRFNENGSAKYDKGTVQRLLLSSMNDAIIELEIKVTDKEKASFEQAKMYSEKSVSSQSKINFL